MVIDRSGKWWVGSEATDIETYLKAYKAKGHAVHETRLCKCGCGSIEFKLEADRDEGCAQRNCASCGEKHLICDSAEYWKDAEPESWACVECRGAICNLAVGFSLSVGNRCMGCGTLGSYVDWKVGYGPSHQLLDQA